MSEVNNKLRIMSFVLACLKLTMKTPPGMILYRSVVFADMH